MKEREGSTFGGTVVERFVRGPTTEGIRRDIETGEKNRGPGTHVTGRRIYG